MDNVISIIIIIIPVLIIRYAISRKKSEIFGLPIFIIVGLCLIPISYGIVFFGVKILEFIIRFLIIS